MQGSDRKPSYISCTYAHLKLHTIIIETIFFLAMPPLLLPVGFSVELVLVVVVLHACSL